MTTYTDSELFDILCDDEGIDPENENDVQRNLFTSRQYGICRACGETSYPHEPDARANWCELCGENKVVSFAELFWDVQG